VILLLDNYDSFTFNLYQAMAALGVEVDVRRNDALTVDEALALEPTAIVLSPGPGRPADAGIAPELLRRLPAAMPLFGVCLGHQGLVERYGGVLERDPAPTHGKASSATCRIPFPPGATIRCGRSATSCRRSCGSRRGRRTVSSWPCDTRASLASACNSTLNRS